jgi:hypothetical protein
MVSGGAVLVAVHFRVLLHDIVGCSGEVFLLLMHTTCDAW